MTSDQRPGNRNKDNAETLSAQRGAEKSSREERPKEPMCDTPRTGVRDEPAHGATPEEKGKPKTHPQKTRMGHPRKNNDNAETLSARRGAESGRV